MEKQALLNSEKSCGYTTEDPCKQKAQENVQDLHESSGFRPWQRWRNEQVIPALVLTIGAFFAVR